MNAERVPPLRFRAGIVGLPLALVWCACASPGNRVRTATERELVPYQLSNGVEYRVPEGLVEPLTPAPYTEWFVPSRWMLKLAERFNVIPDAFIDHGPEYCCVIFVDSNRMVHASIPTRWSDPGKSRSRCPPLGAGADPSDTKQVGIAHQHQTHTGPSYLDINLACATAIEGKPSYTGAIANFFNGNVMLTGKDPETGREAAIPSQHFLITRRAGRMRVFMWVRVVHAPMDRMGAVSLYVPAEDGTDNWRYIAECWISPGAEILEARGMMVKAKCDPEDIWR